MGSSADGNFTICENCGCEFIEWKGETECDGCANKREPFQLNVKLVDDAWFVTSIGYTDGVCAASYDLEKALADAARQIKIIKGID